MPDPEGTAHVLAALMARQAGLRLRFPYSFQAVRTQQITVTRGRELQGRPRYQFGLIKASMLQFASVQRHRDHMDPCCLKKRLQTSYDLSQHAAQHIGCGAYLLVLQHVNKISEAAFVTAVRDSPFVGSLNTAAKPATHFSRFCEGMRTDQALATD